MAGKNALNGYHTGHDRVNRASFIVFVVKPAMENPEKAVFVVAVNDYFNPDKKL